MWIKIRTFGELQILTRASYFMMLLVPILAGIWPAVRVGINKYNAAITDSKAALDSASERIEYIVLSASDTGKSSEQISQILHSLQNNIDLIIQDYSLQVIEKTGLPSVWAFAFLASLAITIGHLIYQATAPALIQNYTFRDYISEEVKRFVETPSEGQLEKARYFSKDYHGDSRDDEMYFSGDSDAQKRKEVTLIERGANVEYRRAAEMKLVYATISGVFYLIGLGLTAWIIASQTVSVINATWGA
ncbi:hypothetical protein MZJ31_004528 [Vibrio parahaemolyticus]|nr:hypothetical protein [Vibrio parahaemolyticus]EJC7109405.1 hypothetical protein [Vibrio parahaemolyticus]